MLPLPYSMYLRKLFVFDAEFGRMSSRAEGAFALDAAGLVGLEHGAEAQGFVG